MFSSNDKMLSFGIMLAIVDSWQHFFKLHKPYSKWEWINIYCRFFKHA